MSIKNEKLAKKLTRRKGFRFKISNDENNDDVFTAKICHNIIWMQFCTKDGRKMAKIVDGNGVKIYCGYCDYLGRTFMIGEPLAEFTISKKSRKVFFKILDGGNC